MRVIQRSVLAAVALIWANPAWGQSPVINPDFDTDVSGWMAESACSLTWDSLDSDAEPGSGSAVVTSLAEQAGNAVGSRQCIDGLSGETEYLFSADTLIPIGQSESGHSYLLVQWYSGSDCTGFLDLTVTSGLQSTTPDVWFTDTGIAESPAGTQSARLRLSVWKTEAAGSLDAHFDHVRFDAVLFADGFENGNITGWTSWDSDCFEFRVGSDLTSVGGVHQTQFSAPVLGGPATDHLRLEFYSSDTGTFDLSGWNYLDCVQCVLAFVDDGAGPTFFQESGTLIVDHGSQPQNSFLDATLIDVTLIEVTIDPVTFVSTPVPGGDCLHATTINVSTPPDR